MVPTPTEPTDRPGRLKAALGSLRRALTRRPSTGTDTPAVSVIVPFHNVEPYLAECIESITSQGGPSLEVLLVDDGSTDASPAIAARHAERDSRITVLSTPSLGPGGARNAGIKQARGDYLAFVDSDDRLAVDALKTLVRAIEADQVDVVVAAVARFNSTRLWNPRWVGSIHDRPRHRIRVEDFPDVIRNNYSWNKLYRRDYWLRQDLWFEDRVTFQDQPLVARLLWRAEAITILDTVVYEYRDRDDRSSISQRTEEYANLRDRVAAWDRTVAAIDADQVPEPVSSAWYRTLLQTHLHWYLRTGSIADPTYWWLLRESYLALRHRFPEVPLESLHARQRLPLTLLERDDPATLGQLLDEGGVDGLDSAPEQGGSRLVPGDALRTTPAESLFTPFSALFVEATIARAGWSARPGELTVNLDVGFASPDRFGAPDQVELEFRDLNGDTVARTDVGTRLAEDGIDQVSGLQHLARFGAAVPPAPAGSYQLWLTVTANARRTQVPVTRLLGAGGAPEAGAVAIPGSALEVRLLPGPHSHAPVRLAIDKPAVSAREVAILADGIRLEITADHSLKGLEFRSSEGRSVFVPPSGATGATTTFTTALPRLEKGEAGSWSILAVDSRGHKRGVRWLQDDGAAGWPRQGDALVARPTTRGNLKLDAFPAGVALATALSTAGLLTVTLPVEGEEHRVESEFDLSGLRASIEPLALPTPGTHRPTPVTTTARLLAQLPVLTQAGLVIRAKPRRLTLRPHAGDPATPVRPS